MSLVGTMGTVFVGASHSSAKIRIVWRALRANQFGVLRGSVSAHLQNEVAGTMQRVCLPSHSRQCGLLDIANMVIRAPPNCGGPGIPRTRDYKLTLAIRAVANNRRELVGEDRGKQGQVARPIIARRNQSRIAA
jgi:hypothetical protein